MMENTKNARPDRLPVVGRTDAGPMAIPALMGGERSRRERAVDRFGPLILTNKKPLSIRMAVFIGSIELNILPHMN